MRRAPEAASPSQALQRIERAQPQIMILWVSGYPWPAGIKSTAPRIYCKLKRIKIIRTRFGNYEMNSTLRKRSIVIGDRRTSVSLEDAFWNAFKTIATNRGTALSELPRKFHSGCGPGNRSSRIRLYVLNCYRDWLSEAEGARVASDKGTRHWAGD